MPTISRFLGIVIAMYFDDHGFPHFHARHVDGQAKVRIDTLGNLELSLVVRNAFDGGHPEFNQPSDRSLIERDVYGQIRWSF